MNGPCNAIYPEKIAMSQENCPFFGQTKYFAIKKIIKKPKKEEMRIYF